jgi:hypothetical protein
MNSRRTYFQDKLSEEAHQRGIDREIAAKQVQDQVEHTMTDLNNKVPIVTYKLIEVTTNAKQYSEEILKCASELVKPDLSPQATASCKSHLSYYEYKFKKATQEQGQLAKELQTLTSTNDPNIIRSDLSEYLFNLVDYIKEYMNNLSSEQMVIIFNLSGYTLLFMIMTSITLMIIGQELINSYQLEVKYPRLAQYIQFQITLRKLYLRFYIVYFYLLITILISINIFMFLFEYIYFLQL